MARKNKSNQVSRELLLKSLLVLMREEKYNSITVTDITLKAGVSRMAYYRNFDSKESIIFAYLNETTQHLLHPINEYLPIPKDEIEYLVMLFKRFAHDSNAGGYNLGLSLEHANRIHFLYDNIYENLVRNFPPVKESVTHTYAMMVGAFCGIYLQWSRRDQPDDIPEYADALYTFLANL